MGLLLHFEQIFFFEVSIFFLIMPDGSYSLLIVKSIVVCLSERFVRSLIF